MKYFFISLAALLACLAYFRLTAPQSPPAPPEQTDAEKLVQLIPSPTQQTHTVSSGDTFTKILERLGFSYSEALAIADAAAETFDFSNVRLGKTFRLISVDGRAQTLEYEPNKEDLVIVDLGSPDYQTQIKPIPYEIAIERAFVTIEQSMFLSGLEAGLTEALILNLAEILAWEIDFAAQVQTGDSFIVVYEKRARHGQDAGAGRILSANFTNVGQTTAAYRFTDSKGETGYFDAEGNSLVRPFLKAPLDYNRISSGYTYARFHPIAHLTGPHRAIDYAAPLGTPIKAVGSGTITYLGWNGGFGKYIDIRHNEIYQTQYAHLSAYAKGLKVGSQVEQGQVIGYVGSTGWSTGPHLHYQVKIRGELVNPLQIEFPKGEALNQEDLELFNLEKDRFNALMNP